MSRSKLLVRSTSTTLTTGLTLALGVALLLAAGCGDEPDNNTDTGMQEDGGVDVVEQDTAEQDTVEDVVDESVRIDFACGDNVIEEGTNTLSTRVRTRLADIHLPTDTTTPAGVVFVYHGFGDSIDNFSNFIAPNTDANDTPLIYVYPHTLNLLPFSSPSGLEWDIFSSVPGDENTDAALFEEVLGCLNEQYDVDPTRIYAVGFSAGAIQANNLYSRYQELVAAVVAMSGAWMNDPNQTENINTLGADVDFNWRDLDPSIGTGALLVTHGGPTDVFATAAAEILNFEEAYVAAESFLLEGGRVFVECAHTRGHTNPPGLTSAMIIDFLLDHQAGVESSYIADGITDNLPAGCRLHL